MDQLCAVLYDTETLVWIVLLAGLDVNKVLLNIVLLCFKLLLFF